MLEELPPLLFKMPAQPASHAAAVTTPIRRSQRRHMGCADRPVAGIEHLSMKHKIRQPAYPAHPRQSSDPERRKSMPQIGL